MNKQTLKNTLDEWYHKTNERVFIANDPICIPHRFEQLQDIEIAGFFAAIMAWGNRTTIINKCTQLLGLMDNEPYQFIIHSKDKEYQRFEGFVHRTMNDTDVLYLLWFLKKWYREHNSLEAAFVHGLGKEDETVEGGLMGFYNLVFSGDNQSKRTQKHIATPAKKSACKRLNMYLRWMVRKDTSGVDFGIWNQISPSQLVCPLDVHVHRVALSLGLIDRTQADWKTALLLTESLREFDSEDPVKYDYALFGLGLSGFGK